MRAPLALLALALVAAVPFAASAAPVADKVVAEVSTPFDIGVYGSTVAYTRRVGKSGVELVIQTGDGAPRRIPAGSGNDESVDVGLDARGKRVVVYTRCGKRCKILAVPAVSGRTRTIASNLPTVYDVSVGKGRVVWIQGNRVRSRALTGGRIRTEGVDRDVSPTELDTDGRTIAVTGGYPEEYGQGATALSVTRMGTGRGRLRATRTYGEEYAAYRSPVVTKAGVSSLFDSFSEGVSSSFADFAAGKDGHKDRTAGGMEMVEWDAGGGRVAFIEGNGSLGCDLGSLQADIKLADAPCRIVTGSATAERLLPPSIALTDTTATVRQVALQGERITARRPLAGVNVQVRRPSGALFTTLVTDAQGRVTLPRKDDDDGFVLVAATTPVPSYGLHSDYY